MVHQIFQKLAFATVATTLGLGTLTNTMFNQAFGANLNTQKFQGNLTLNDSLFYSGPKKISYSGLVKYLEPSQGSSCPQGICVPLKEENWTFRLNEKQLNSSVYSFEGVAIFESTSSSTPLEWSMHWLSDITGDSGHYTVTWQQATGLNVSNTYFRGYYFYSDSNPTILYSSIPVSNLPAVPEPSQEGVTLLSLGVFSLAALLRRKRISRQA